MKIKHIHCPVNGTDCPYYTDHGHPCRCVLQNPYIDCDDFANMWDFDDDWIDDDWEDDSPPEEENDESEFKYYDDCSNDYHKTYDEARDACIEHMDIQDIIDNADVSVTEMFKELARLDSPLYFQYLEEATERFCKYNIHEVEEE